MAIEYDPVIIGRYASRLYTRARSITVLYTFLGGVIAVGGIGFVARAADFGTFGMGMGEMLIIGLVGALIGYVLGSERAFWLRLQAQNALCQAQIELNTRHLGTRRGAAVGAVDPSGGQPQP